MGLQYLAKFCCRAFMCGLTFPKPSGGRIHEGFSMHLLTRKDIHFRDETLVKSMRAPFTSTGCWEGASCKMPFRDCKRERPGASPKHDDVSQGNPYRIPSDKGLGFRVSL